MQESSEERTCSILRTFPRGTSAPPATETATPGLGYTVIQDPAQIPTAKHPLFETRMPLLLLSLGFMPVITKASRITYLLSYQSYIYE